VSSRVLVTHPDAAGLVRAVEQALGERLPWVAPGAPGAGEADAWFCASRPPAEALALPRLRWIQSGWAGIDAWLDRPEWREGVSLTRTVGDFPQRIAEYVFGYLLARELDVPEALRQMEARAWKRWAPGSVAGRSLLIVGYGAIGRVVGEVGRALGMGVTGVRRGPVSADERTRGVRTPEELPSLLAAADVVVNLLPATRDTESFWTDERFRSVREGAVFVNASRGSTVDEDALLRGIARGRPARAILDVFREEPLPPGHPLRGRPEIWITPHVAGTGTLGPLALEFAENWRRYREGRPLQHVVDRRREY
jgi:phosphoglycerate dehydrogenase-like enzyme